MREWPINAVFIGALTLIAIAGMVCGIILATRNYSSAAAFSIAAACVGVLGTLAGEQRIRNGERHE